MATVRGCGGPLFEAVDVSHVSAQTLGCGKRLAALRTPQLLLRRSCVVRFFHDWRRTGAKAHYDLYELHKNRSVSQYTSCTILCAWILNSRRDSWEICKPDRRRPRLRLLTRRGCSLHSRVSFAVISTALPSMSLTTWSSTSAGPASSTDRGGVESRCSPPCGRITGSCEIR